MGIAAVELTFYFDRFNIAISFASSVPDCVVRIPDLGALTTTLSDFFLERLSKRAFFVIRNARVSVGDHVHWKLTETALSFSNQPSVMSDSRRVEFVMTFVSPTHITALSTSCDPSSAATINITSPCFFCLPPCLPVYPRIPDSRSLRDRRPVPCPTPSLTMQRPDGFSAMGTRTMRKCREATEFLRCFMFVKQKNKLVSKAVKG